MIPPSVVVSWLGHMLKLVFWIFVLFLALSYFGISIESIVRSPVGQENILYINHLLLLGWHWISSRLC